MLLKMMIHPVIMILMIKKMKKKKLIRLIQVLIQDQIQEVESKKKIYLQMKILVINKPKNKWEIMMMQHLKMGFREF